MTFAVSGDLSFALPLTCWLYDYMGMLPVAVETVDEQTRHLEEKFISWLSEIGCAEVWQRAWQTSQPDVLFADGQQVEEARMSGTGGIEIFLPTAACLDIVPKVMLGNRGGAWLVEQLLKELRWAMWV
jgi:nitrogenase molybdenum-iron protein alpha/beta subunit